MESSPPAAAAGSAASIPGTYAFGNQRQVPPERLRLLAELLDEGTFTVLAALGVRSGWRCLEAGAGGGSVAAWLAGRVAPEGFVLATDLDTTILRGACELFTKVIDAHHAVLAGRHAFDPFHGRRLAGDLTEAGLVNTGCQGRLAIWQGGQPGGRVWQLTLIQLRDALAGSGLVTATDVDQVIEMCGDSRLRFMSQATIAAWGYRPRRRSAQAPWLADCAVPFRQDHLASGTENVLGHVTDRIARPGAWRCAG